MKQKKKQNPILFKKHRWGQQVLCTLLSLSLITAPSISLGQNNSKVKSHIGTAVDPKTDTEYKIEFPYASREELKQARPSSLNRFDKAFQNQMNQMYPGGSVRTTMRRFPTEALIFYAAMGATMVQDSLIDPHTKGGRLNPNWLDTLTHEATSPVGLAGFGAFMLASGKTGELLFRAAHHIDKRSRNYAAKKGKTITDHQQRRNSINSIKHTSSGVSKALRALSGQIGMAAGMMASNVVHEFAYDPNVLSCRESMKQPDSPHVDPEACDRAFDHWVLSPHGRIYDWFPDIVAMLSASVLSHAMISKLGKPTWAKIKKGLPISVKGYMMKLGSLKFLRFGPPMAHVGMTFINLYSFMNIHAKVTDPLIARPWKNSRKSKGLVEATFELEEELEALRQKSFQTPSRKIPSCVLAKKEEKKLSDRKSLDLNSPLDNSYSLLSLYQQKCVKEKSKAHPTIAALEELGKKQSDWRSFNLEPAWAAYSGWQQSVMELLESYEAAETFYYGFFQERSWFKGKFTADNPFLKDPQYLDKVENSSSYFPHSFKNNHPKSIHGTRTPRTVDYLITSMICGPDAQKNPKSLIKNPTFGISYEFIPPRVIEGFDKNLCKEALFTQLTEQESIPTTGNIMYDTAIREAHLYEDSSKGENLLLEYLQKSGFNHKNLVSFAHDHLRQDLIGSKNGELQFKKWWSQYVAPEFFRKVAELEKEYQKMMKTIFIPGFTTKEVKQVNLSQKQDRLIKHWSQKWKSNLIQKYLSPMPEAEDSYNYSFTLAKGTKEHFSQELITWFELLNKLSSAYSINQNEITSLQKEFLQTQKDMLENTSLKASEGEDFNKHYKNSQEALRQISALFQIDFKTLQNKNPRYRISLRQKPLKEQIAISILTRLNSLTQEITEHRAVVQLLPH